jgi:hypothetical protein
MAPNEYLEQCLEEHEESSTPSAKKHNQIRRTIKEGLGQRHCFPLVRATMGEEDLQSLGSLKQYPVNIRSDFVGQV